MQLCLQSKTHSLPVKHDPGWPLPLAVRFSDYFPLKSSGNVCGRARAAAPVTGYWLFSSDQTTSGETQQHGLARFRVTSAVQFCSHSSRLTATNALLSRPQWQHHWMTWASRNEISEWPLGESKALFTLPVSWKTLQHVAASVFHGFLWKWVNKDFNENTESKPHTS